MTGPVSQPASVQASTSKVPDGKEPSAVMAALTCREKATEGGLRESIDVPTKRIPGVQAIAMGSRAATWPDGWTR